MIKYLENLSEEEKEAVFKFRSELKQQASDAREKYIQDAINAGATVHKITNPLSGSEQETIVRYSNDTNEMIIDTTISSIIVKCIKRGYKIIDVTYYQDRVVGATFQTTKNYLTFRTDNQDFKK